MASELKDGLNSLGPIDFHTIDTNDPSSYLKNAFSLAEKLVNSVPPPHSDNSSQHDPPAPANSASKATDTVYPAPPSSDLDAENASLHKAWGKPMKLSAKDNPLHVAVFKMAAHDRHGAWFARRSVHQGLGFEKWKRAMMREFLESAKHEGVGAGAIRGIGADKRIETIMADDMGKLEVWQLSAVFPGPVTPREFVTLLATSENALSSASIGSNAASQKPPRHFIVISRPVTHDACPDRANLVKGTYESIEIIRELPLEKSPEDDPEAAEANPIEWIMITRSDPGGGIPRFMVERGTPGSIVGDVSKFLNWACSLQDIPPKEEVEKELDRQTAGTEPEQKDLQKETRQELQEPSTNGPVVASGVQVDGHAADLHTRQEHDRGDATPRGQQVSSQHAAAPPSEHPGMIASLTDAVESTVHTYFPNLHLPAWPQLPTTAHFGRSYSSSSSASTASSLASSSLEEFTSAQEQGAPSHPKNRASVHAPIQFTPVSSAVITNPEASEVSLATSIHSSPASSILDKDKSVQHALTHHERELEKIRRKRAILDEKIAATREAKEARAQEAATREVEEDTKAREKHERHQRKAQDKYQREIDKLEEKRQKEQTREEEAQKKAERRIDAKRRKATEKSELRKAQDERDTVKERLRIAEHEASVLRAQVERLQRENTVLVARMGEDDVRKVMEEFETRVKEATKEGGGGRARGMTGASISTTTLPARLGGGGGGGAGSGEGSRTGSMEVVEKTRTEPLTGSTATATAMKGDGDRRQEEVEMLVGRAVLQNQDSGVGDLER